jgi:eukaryotic-like serine/threonine-protein kinase
MADERKRTGLTLSLEALRRHDRLCDEFEAQWRAGQKPLIDKHLVAVPFDERTALLQMLLLVELDLRRELGENPTADEYRARFPANDSIIEKLFETRTATFESQEYAMADVLATENNAELDNGRLTGTLGPGAVLGDYKLDELLGRGGMGVVFRAYQHGADRMVALKLIKPGLLDGVSSEKRLELMERFRTEAQAAAGLAHDHIVTVFEVGEVDGSPFYSMRYIEGQSLARLLQLRQLTGTEAASLLEPVCRAVHAAHVGGFLHRDLKPSNILVENSGRPYVADFGLAKRLESVSSMTQTGVPLGTPPYMSPEQIIGKPLDARSDVYSLGATLYEMLTRRSPFRADNPASMLRRILDEDPTPPRSLNHLIPRDLETICLKCMRKDATRRYASAEALADDLKRFLSRQPIHGRRVGRAEKAWFWLRRNRALSAVGGLAAVSLLVCLALAVAYGISSQQPPSEPIEPLAELHMRRGLAMLEKGEIAPGLLWLVRALDASPGEPDLERVIRLNFAAWSQGLCTCKTMIPHENTISSACYCSDGSIVTASDDQTVRRWDGSTGTALGQIWRDNKPVRTLAIGPDGTTILVGGGKGGVRLWDFRDGKELLRFQGQDGYVLTVAMSPDGKSIIAGGTDPIFRKWDRQTGHELLNFKGHDAAILAMVFSPDGKLILTGSQDRTARIWDAHSGEELRKVGQHAAPVRCVAFSPDGRTVFTASDEARLWEVSSGQPIGTAVRLRLGAKTVAFSRDGSKIAFGGGDGRVEVWDSNLDRAMCWPMQNPGPVNTVAFSPDGHNVFAGGSDRTGRIWTLPAESALTLRHPNRERLEAAKPSPDGRLALLVGSGNSCQLFETATARPIGTALKHASSVTGASFSPDSKMVVTCSADHTACIWEIESGRMVSNLEGYPHPLLSLAVSPDGKTVLTGSAGNVAQLWDASSFAPIGAPLEHNGAIFGVAFSPDGRTMATASDDRTAQLWDAHSGNRLSHPLLHGSWVKPLAFSPDSQVIVTGSMDGKAYLWESRSGKSLCPALEHGNRVWAVAFSPDGKSVATASWDKSARLWDSATGEKVHTWTHDSQVWSVAYSPDAKLLASGSVDGTARIWDLARGTAIGPPLSHHGPVRSVEFARDGRTLMTGSADTTARIWKVPVATTDSTQTIKLWIQVAAGIELANADSPDELSVDDWKQRKRLAENMGIKFP